MCGDSQTTFRAPPSKQAREHCRGVEIVQTHRHVSLAKACPVDPYHRCDTADRLIAKGLVLSRASRTRRQRETRVCRLLGEIKLGQTYRLDLRASAYAIRQWDMVDQDTPKQTNALESIAASVKKIAGA